MVHSSIIILFNYSILIIIIVVVLLLVNELPVLKAAAIKYIMIFRSLMGQHLHFVPHLIRHLSAKSVVVHSYAACALDALMVMRDSSNNLM